MPAQAPSPKARKSDNLLARFVLGAASGLGAALLAPLVSALMEQLGWQGTFWSLGAVGGAPSCRSAVATQRATARCSACQVGTVANARRKQPS
jgi:hypothetical protein